MIGLMDIIIYFNFLHSLIRTVWQTIFHCIVILTLPWKSSDYKWTHWAAKDDWPAPSLQEPWHSDLSCWSPPWSCLECRGGAPATLHWNKSWILHYIPKEPTIHVYDLLSVKNYSFMPSSHQGFISRRWTPMILLLVYLFHCDIFKDT